MHSAPKGTILGLISVGSMSLYFTGKKSNLTGLCEIWNNFDLKISEHSPKSNIYHVKAYIERKYLSKRLELLNFIS